MSPYPNRFQPMDRSYRSKISKTFDYNYLPKSFNLNETAPTTYSAFLYRAKVNWLLDDNNNPEGLFVPHYLCFIETMNEKDTNTIVKNVARLVETYSVPGAFYTIEGGL